jgi:aspartyl-tRNA(Asn)/glutamyl-tRNA(Gln) amidotransferase subunit C
MPRLILSQGSIARATDNDRPRCYDPLAMADSRISLEQVRHVALLARLEFSDPELERLRADMDEMLAYVEKLGELDTASVEPTTQVGEAGTPLRRDEVTNRPAAVEMLSNAPSAERGYFKVPKIIE